MNSDSLNVNYFNDQDYYEDKYTLIDNKETLKTTVNFVKNKVVPIHRWYPFVEGFSEEFINNILSEIESDHINCLEPFSGSGTTPLVLQSKGIRCESFEVSPFMHLLTTVKLRTDYSFKGYTEAIKAVKCDMEYSFSFINPIFQPPLMKSMVESENKEKWLFNKEVMKGILDIKYAISKLSNIRYRNLFKIALASILVDISNVYRNGKCLSYKKNWELKLITRENVHDFFLEKLECIFKEDIKLLEKEKKNHGKLFSNHKLSHYGDVRKKIELVENNSINLVITSPPYLNSRDYTDTYMIELWILDLVKDYESVRELRSNTIRSHVQVKWKSESILDIKTLVDAYNQIISYKDLFWNESIPDMIVGYFNDMDVLFNKLYSKMSDNGKIYFNVANSAYYGVHVPTDIIIAEIAEKNGFNIEDIRIARNIQPSSQQKDKIKELRESVIVMRK